MLLKVLSTLLLIYPLTDLCSANVSNQNLASPSIEAASKQTEEIAVEPLTDLTTSSNNLIAIKSSEDGTCGFIKSPFGLEQEGLNTAQESYIFVNLAKIASNSKDSKPINFYRNKDLNGSPAYTLDSSGFKQEGKTICKWSNFLGGQTSLFYLSECSKEKHLFLGYLRNYEENYCSVFNVNASYSNKSKKIVYEVNSGNDLLYFDSTDLSQSEKNSILWTKELRARKTYDLLSLRIHAYVSFMMKIKESKTFENLVNCYWNKDQKCLLGYVSSQFKKDLQGFCNDAYSEDIQKKFTLSYIREFINFINLLETNKLEPEMISNPKDLTIKDKVFFRPKDFHSSDMTEPSIGIEFKDNTLILETYYYGVSC